MNAINLTVGNCLPAMRTFADKAFDLAIVDPPYFSGPERRKFYGARIGALGVERIEYPVTAKWKAPGQDYFDELFRVSKHQIIWGCNYYDVKYPGSGRIVWDKCNLGTSFSDCEIAYCSLHDSVRLFRYMWNGMMQGGSIENGHLQQGNKSLNQKRIHPTEKPIDLYRWLLKNYAKPGFKILDTHCGSGSIMLACHDLQLDLTAYELEPQHVAAAIERFEEYKNKQVNQHPIAFKTKQKKPPLLLDFTGANPSKTE